MSNTSQPTVSPIPSSSRPSPQNGSSLPAMNSPGDGGDVQLLERAKLLLARDVLRRQQCPDDGDERNQDAGNHVVLVVEARVVAVTRADVDRRTVPRAG